MISHLTQSQTTETQGYAVQVGRDGWVALVTRQKVVCPWIVWKGVQYVSLFEAEAIDCSKMRLYQGRVPDSVRCRVYVNFFSKLASKLVTTISKTIVQKTLDMKETVQRMMPD